MPPARESDTNGFFKVVFLRSSDFAMKRAERAGEKFGDGSEKSSEKLLAFFAAKRTASAREAAAALGISQRAVEKQIAALKTRELLKRIGPDKGGHWEVVH